MSRVAIAGNVSGTGVFTLESPNSNTNRTLVLPDEAGTVLTSASSLAAASLTGTIAKARLPAGSVLQVVYASTTTQATTTSSTYVDTGFSASITPTSSSSKILIIGSVIIRVGTGNNNYQHTIFRNGATNLAPNGFRGFIQCRDAGGSQSDMTPAFAYLDSPATTSATTYNWYHKSEGSVSVVFAVDSSFAQLTLMEIAG